MRKSRIGLCIGVVVVGIVSACGGGGGVSGQGSTTVASITAGPVMYSQRSVFTVSGANLTGATVTASGSCGSLSELTGGTSSARQFACSPTSTGTVNLSVADAAATVLKQEPFTVPNPQVKFVTTSGDILVELNPTKAPKTVNNFLLYVKDKFYDNTQFHRVISGFVVQGGGFGVDGVQKAASHPTLELEAPAVTGLSNTAGTIAMARTTVLNSATSQFYFNTVDNSASLDATGGGYAVFGTVLQGMDVVHAIEAVPVHTDPLNPGNTSSPVTVVAVTSATQVQ